MMTKEVVREKLIANSFYACLRREQIKKDKERKFNMTSKLYFCTLKGETDVLMKNA